MVEVPEERPPIDELPIPKEGFIEEDPVEIPVPIPNEEVPVDKLVPIEDPVDEPIPIPNEGFMEELPVLIDGGIVEELIDGFIDVDPVVIEGFIVVVVPVEYPVAICDGSTVLLDGRTLVVEEMVGLLGSVEEG